LVDPQSQDQRTEAPDRFDRCAMTQCGDFEVEHTRRDRKACVEANQVAVVGHPSDGALTEISDFALKGFISLIS
jgi:hypothetical protein